MQGIAQTLVTPSTTDNAPCSFIIEHSVFISFAAPVEVSLWVNVTIFISLSVSSQRRFFKTSGLITSPASTSIFSTFAPRDSAIFAQRLPKFPITSDKTLSPSLIRFSRAAHIAPVPLDVNIKTSFSV